MGGTAQKIEIMGDSRARRASDDDGAQTRIMAEIARLGLERNRQELDEIGYTILTPEQAAPAAFHQRVLDKILDVAEQASGERPNLVDGTSYSDQTALISRGAFFPDIFFKDPVFEQVLMTEAPLALITYLLGESCELAAMNALLKVTGSEHLAIHVDTPQPEPLPPYAQVANATWLLTDYNKENGGTVMLPGSHKWCSHPMGDEVTDMSRGVVIEAPAGSVLLWHGNLWHGALPRTAAGIRVSLITYFTRFYLRRMVSGLPLSGAITSEMLARNPERFAALVHRENIPPDHQWYCRRSQFA